MKSLVLRNRRYDYFCYFGQIHIGAEVRVVTFFTNPYPFMTIIGNFRVLYILAQTFILFQPTIKTAAVGYWKQHFAIAKTVVKALTIVRKLMCGNKY